MSGITVHILTTTGPATIQRIREEDSHVASVICLDGRAEALPVSQAYDAFVRKPVGIVEKLTGHDAYRMDVSARVDEGRSWQLSAYIAHVVNLSMEAPDLHIFATGEVDDALSVRAVEHITEKLQALSIFLETNDIPREQTITLIPSSTKDTPADHDGIPIHGVATVSDALHIIGLDMAGKPQVRPITNRNSLTISRGKGWMKWAATASVIGLLFWFGADFARWQAISNQGRAFELEQAISDTSNIIATLRSTTFRKWLSFKKPMNGSVTFDGSVSTAANSNACMIPKLIIRGPLTKPPGKDQTVCEIVMNAYVSDPSLKVVGRMAYWPNGLSAAERAARTMRGHGEPNGRRWILQFKNMPKPGAVVRLVTITGRSMIQGAQPWYQDLLRAKIDSATFMAARQRIEVLGYNLVVKDWRRE